MPNDFELFESFKQFNWLLHKRRLLEDSTNSNDLDITKAQGRILIILSIEGSLSTKELCTRAGLNTSYLNEILSKMEKSGLVIRKPSDKDKRIIINCLTEKGQSLVPSHLNLSFFDCLSKEQKEQLFTIMNLLNDQLKIELKNYGNKDFLNLCNKENTDCLSIFPKTN